jgi:hypothetical protein
MNIEENINTYLVTQLGVKVYPNKKPIDSALPCIVYKKISTLPIRNLSAKTTWFRNRFQFTLYDDNYGDCQELALSLIGKLDTYKTTFESYLIDGLDIEETTPNLYSTELDFYVWFHI